MKVTKWFKPYIQEKYRNNPTPGRDLSKDIAFKSGCYLVKDTGNNRVIYVGMSTTQLYKTIYRHFQTWNDKEQERVIFDKTGFLVRVILCTPKQATRLEKYLINAYKPKYNKNKSLSTWTADDEKASKEALERAGFIPREDTPF